MAAVVVGFPLGGAGTAAATPMATSTATTTLDVGTVPLLVEFLPTADLDSAVAAVTPMTTMAVAVVAVAAIWSPESNGDRDATVFVTGHRVATLVHPRRGGGRPREPSDCRQPTHF